MLRSNSVKIILLDNIPKLGSIGAEVVVKSGYARNFLFPQAKAILATKKNLKDFKEQQLMLQTKAVENKIKAESCAEMINKLDNIVVKAKSGLGGKLFGSIGSRDIAKVLTESVGFKIFKSQVRLPNHDVLRSIGEYEIKIHIYENVFAKVRVVVLSKSPIDIVK